MTSAQPDIVPLYQPELTPWQRLTPAEKHDAVREQVETLGNTYGAAAVALGCSRLAIAGTIERSRRKASPIIANSGAKNQHLPKRAKANKAGKPSTRFKKQPHQGLTVLVPLGEPTDAYTPPAGAWAPLPGSSPVLLHLLEPGGCRWPTGADSPFLFCALPVHGEGVYCADHAAVAYREPPPQIKKGRANGP